MHDHEPRLVGDAAQDGRVKGGIVRERHVVRGLDEALEHLQGVGAGRAAVSAACVLRLGRPAAGGSVQRHRALCKVHSA